MAKTARSPRTNPTSTRNPPSRGRPRWAVPVGASALVLIALCIALLAAFGGAPARSAAASSAAISPQSMATVLTVNGQEVPVRELELLLVQDRAAAFAYYQQHYGDADHDGFWTTAYGGETPASYLKKLAISDVVDAAIQFGLAHSHGLIPDPGYAALLRSLAGENARRRQALSQSQPVYGPEQYTESDYFTYVLGQIGISLQPALVKEGAISVSDTVLELYYDSHRQDYQRASGTDTGASGSQTAAFETFAQAKSQVTQDYEASAYNALIARLAAAASVHIDSNVLASVQIS